MTLDKSNKKYLIISSGNSKKGTGSDFYLEIMEYFKKEGFRCHNTFRFGHLTLFMYELYLLIAIPRYSRVVTTWPGFPRQILALGGFSNRIRFRLVALISRKKKWGIYLLPVDLPLKQFRNRLSDTFVLKQSRIERDYFETFSAFFTCGSGMTEYYTLNFPGKPIIPFDIYSQNLPAATGNEAGRKESGVIKIAISGNLKRMGGNINILPVQKYLEYYFTGPYGDEISTIGRSDFKYLGVIVENELLNVLSGFSYGLIYYSPEEESYFSLVIAGKLTTYVLAGLPIICPARFSSMAELVQRKKLGIVISDYSEITRLSEIKAEEYNILAENIRVLGEHIREGKVYTEVLLKANLID